jgi:flavin reductase (DIM6/NTAB) family NADH-FMN oxidoreductase RutF
VPFSTVSRQEFRKYFQPSRLVLCIVADERTESGVNVITLSFSMHCSYQPTMMAIAVHDVNESHRLIQQADEFVLAVAGENLAEAAMTCGWESSKNVDKVKFLRLDLMPSETVATPSLRQAIANVELVRRSVTPSGDHVVVIGEVRRFAVNTEAPPRPLLSVGPDTSGYRVLLQRGIHRIAVVDG